MFISPVMLLPYIYSRSSDGNGGPPECLPLAGPGSE